MKIKKTNKLKLLYLFLKLSSYTFLIKTVTLPFYNFIIAKLFESNRTNTFKLCKAKYLRLNHLD